MKQSYLVKTDGYWRQSAISGIPAHSGVYFVYAATYDKSSDSVSLQKLIYIGEAGDVKSRISNHEKWYNWRGHLTTGQELCFSTGYVSPISRERVEAAYIFKHKPAENIEYKYSFPFNETTVNSSGRTALLETYFTV